MKDKDFNSLPAAIYCSIREGYTSCPLAPASGPDLLPPDKLNGEAEVQGSDKRVLCRFLYLR